MTRGLNKITVLNQLNELSVTELSFLMGDFIFVTGIVALLNIVVSLTLSSESILGKNTSDEKIKIKCRSVRRKASALVLHKDCDKS